MDAGTNQSVGSAVQGRQRQRIAPQLCRLYGMRDAVARHYRLMCASACPVPQGRPTACKQPQSQPLQITVRVLT